MNNSACAYITVSSAKEFFKFEINRETQDHSLTKQIPPQD